MDVAIGAFRDDRISGGFCSGRVPTDHVHSCFVLRQERCYFATDACIRTSDRVNFVAQVQFSLEDVWLGVCFDRCFPTSARALALPVQEKLSGGYKLTDRHFVLQICGFVDECVLQGAR